MSPPLQYPGIIDMLRSAVGPPCETSSRLRKCVPSRSALPHPACLAALLILSAKLGTVIPENHMDLKRPLRALMADTFADLSRSFRHKHPSVEFDHYVSFVEPDRRRGFQRRVPAYLFAPHLPHQWEAPRLHSEKERRTTCSGRPDGGRLPAIFTETIRDAAGLGS